MDKPELKLSVFSDYICPFCYIGSRRLLRLNDTYDVKINWCGLEIHPDTPAEGMPIERLGYAPAQWRAMMDNLQVMAEAEGLTLQAHDFTTNSRQALLLAEAAKQAGRERFYALHERLFSAFFSDGLNIGDADVLRNLAQECGLERDLVESAWQDPRYGQRLDINLRHAVELGVTGTPSYVFGTQVLVGAVAEAELRQAAAQLLAAH
jgi:predicted DsbA family dithiol-disulfide isomerase